MSYNKTNWHDGDIISEERLNNVEQGISNLDTQYNDATNQINNVKQGISNLNTQYNNVTNQINNVKQGINNLNTQYNDIANEDLVIGADGKLHIKQGDGTLKGTGVILPTSSTSSGVYIPFEELSSEECTIEETVNGTALLLGTVGCGSVFAYDETGNIIAHDEGNIDDTSRKYNNGTCNFVESEAVDYDNYSE